MEICEKKIKKYILFGCKKMWEEMWNTWENNSKSAKIKEEKKDFKKFPPRKSRRWRMKKAKRCERDVKILSHLAVKVVSSSKIDEMAEEAKREW